MVLIKSKDLLEKNQPEGNKGISDVSNRCSSHPQDDNDYNAIKQSIL